MLMVNNAIDRKGMEGGGALEHSQESVAQPNKLPTLNGMAELISAIDSISVPSETSGEGPSNDWSGQSGGAMVKSGQQSGMSPRDRAIANLPAPAVMAKQLEGHIRAEIKDLRKQVGSITSLRRPGAAFRLAELYARIRRLHSLLNELLESSYEVLRRVFIKVFIDKQSIL